MMPAFYACRIEGQHNPVKRIDQHKCLVQNTTKTTLVVRLHYSEWNRDAPSETSVNGVLVRCYFNPKEPNSNYIVAYGYTKVASKRAIMQFLEQYPLVEPGQVNQKVPFYNPPSLQYA